MTASAGPRHKALYAFSPRAIEVEYVSIPEMPVTFLDASVNLPVSPNTSECITTGCDPLYPFDTRNLSIGDFLDNFIQLFDGSIVQTFDGQLVNLF